MANTITYAKEYVNNQDENLQMLNQYLLCADLLVKNPIIRGKKVEYDRKSFASYVMGTYDRVNGLTSKALIFERVEKNLTQDRGDELELDIRDKEEAQIADGIMSEYNFYNVKVKVPTMDGYAFGQFAKQQSGASFIASGSIDGTNAYEKLLDAEEVLLNKRVKLGECILYASVSFHTLLKKANLTKAFITIGSWNNSVSTNIKMVDGMKLVEVPNATLGENVNFLIVHPLSSKVFNIMDIVNYLDKVKGHPGKAFIDVRAYFDAWVEPTGGDGIVVSLSKPRELTLTENADHSVSITGVETGAKVYYKNSAGATSSDTEVQAGADGTYKIDAPSSTKTFYVVQYIGTTKSDEKSITITIA